MCERVQVRMCERVCLCKCLGGGGEREGGTVWDETFRNDWAETAFLFAGDHWKVNGVLLSLKKNACKKW